MLNQVSLHGRLGRDPEIRYTQQENIPVATVSIAVSRDGKNAGTDWIDLVAWRNTAEFLEKYFRKGDEILVTGRLQIRDYQDRNGNKRRTAEVVVSHVDFCGKKEDRETSTPTQQAPPPTPDEFGFVKVDDAIQEELPWE